MSEPKNQHIIPQCYLKQFVDPHTPAGQEPYVWIFDKKSKKGKKKAPKNILAETDFYTIKLESGGKDYSIEKTLSQIESEYSSIFERKIKPKLPIDDYEHVVVCVFVAAMFQRTLAQRENIEGMLDQMIEMTQAMEQGNGLPPKRSAELKREKENAHKINLVQMIPRIAEILIRMNLAFLCSSKKGSFITSDTPCFMFNPDLQWQRFYGPGLGQKHVEVRMPLSPEISIDFSWINNLRGYLNIDTDLVHELNRMVFGYSNQYFIANSSKVKRRWFRRFPLDPIFIFRILNKKIRFKLMRLYRRYKYYV